MVVRLIVFFSSANLICRSTDISSHLEFEITRVDCIYVDVLIYRSVKDPTCIKHVCVACPATEQMSKAEYFETCLNPQTVFLLASLKW